MRRQQFADHHVQRFGLHLGLRGSDLTSSQLRLEVSIHLFSPVFYHLGTGGVMQDIEDQSQRGYNVPLMDTHQRHTDQGIQPIGGQMGGVGCLQGSHKIVPGLRPIAPWIESFT